MLLVLVLCYLFNAAIVQTGFTSCSITGSTGCRRCDCVPDCVDLSDEKNCTYGSLDDLFMSMEFVLKQSRTGKPFCGTDKFFPPPPLPPFALCNEPITVAPSSSTPIPLPTLTSSTPAPHPQSTMTQAPPKITTARNQAAYSTNQNRPFSTPSRATPSTTSSVYNTDTIRKFWELCDRYYTQYGDKLICTGRLWSCFSNPHLCARAVLTSPSPPSPPRTTTATTTTTTTTTTMRMPTTRRRMLPRPVYPPIVSPYYYDYYNGYDASWNWNYLFF